eukprot:g17517.t1
MWVTIQLELRHTEQLRVVLTEFTVDQLDQGGSDHCIRFKPKNNNARVTTDTTFATVHQNPHSKKERGLNESPWIKIYNKRDDKALLQILNLNIKQFQTLHESSSAVGMMPELLGHYLSCLTMTRLLLFIL